MHSTVKPQLSKPWERNSLDNQEVQIYEDKLAINLYCFLKYEGRETSLDNEKSWLKGGG